MYLKILKILVLINYQHHDAKFVKLNGSTNDIRHKNSEGSITAYPTNAEQIPLSQKIHQYKPTRRLSPSRNRNAHPIPSKRVQGEDYRESLESTGDYIENAKGVHEEFSKPHILKKGARNENYDVGSNARGRMVPDQKATSEKSKSTFPEYKSNRRINALSFGRDVPFESSKNRPSSKAFKSRQQHIQNKSNLCHTNIEAKFYFVMFCLICFSFSLLEINYQIQCPV